jgi:tetratricopeptide (TPR) repeat protein
MASPRATLPKRVDFAKKALIAAEKLSDAEMQAWLHIDAIGYAFEAMSEPNEALNHIKTGQLIARQANSIDCLAAADVLLAYWNMKFGERDKALQHIQSALSSATGPATKVRAYLAQANFYKRHNEWEKVRESYLIAVEIAAKDGASLDEASTQKKLGEIALRMGDLDLAEKAYLRFEKLASEYGWLKYLADSMIGLAHIARSRGNPQEAWNYAGHAKTIYEQIGRTDKIEEADRFLQK